MSNSSNSRTASRRSKCARCTAPIDVGDAIAQHGPKWVHETCATVASGLGTTTSPERMVSDDSSGRVCRHWRKYGCCGYGERCAFDHPCSEQRAAQVVLGLGTGRCGTLSLSLLLNRQLGAKVRHEPEVDQDFFCWDAGPEERRKCVSRHYEIMREWHRPLVGAVHYAYLPYVEDYIAQNPGVKIVVLERSREEVIQSWLRFTVGTNHWQPPADRPQNRWERSFPTYRYVSNSTCCNGRRILLPVLQGKAIGWYWDEYQTRISKLANVYPQQVRIWDFRAVLNDEKVQKQMLHWVGVTEPVLVVGEVTHASSPSPAAAALEVKPEPSQQLESSNTRWWQELELEEMRQDLRSELQLEDDKDEAESTIVHNVSDQFDQDPICETTLPAIATATGVGTVARTSHACGPCLLCKTPARDSYQCYSSALAWDRWHTEKPLRIVDYELGFPVVVKEASGYPTPPPGSCVAAAQHSADVRHAAERWLAKGRPIHPSVDLEPRASSSEGLGVFVQTGTIAAGEIVGAYMGTIRTEEEWEEQHWENHHCVCINDGASGVVVDGGVGSTNVLRYLNHSCDPNAQMKYIWLSNGSWHALLFALRNIAASEEVTFDYELVTEDPEEPQLQLRCNCGAQRCRGTLFTFREW